MGAQVRILPTAKFFWAFLQTKWDKKVICFIFSFFETLRIWKSIINNRALKEEYLEIICNNKRLVLGNCAVKYDVKYDVWKLWTVKYDATYFL